jgi:hypothetical protein
MIKIVRVNRINIEIANSTLSEVKPAGEVFIFDGKFEVEQCCSFMWGRDINNYMIFRNGYRVEMTSDLYELSNRLRELE